MELKPGTLLQGGKYKIIRVCGQGGFGVTYEGTQELLGKVAIKEFFVKDFCERDDESQQITVATRSKRSLVESLEMKFYKEAQNLFRLRHENIVRVTDVFKENGTAYYVMDYIDGPTINQLLKEEPEHRMEEKEALDYFVQVCDALRYIHGKKMLHLDIKPANILVQPCGKRNKVILIDFGVSKQYDEKDGENTSTIAGRSMGYSPIEQMENTIKHFMPATDIFALGATLYRMVTGEKPPSISDIIRNGDKVVCPDFVSRKCQTVIKKCMRLNAQDRPQSIDDVLNLLATGEQSINNNDEFEDDDCTQLSSSPSLLVNKPKATPEPMKKDNILSKFHKPKEKKTPVAQRSKEEEKRQPSNNNVERQALIDDEKKKKLMYIIGGIIVACVLVVILLSIPFSQETSEEIETDTTSVAQPAVKFDEAEFNRLIDLADADAPLTDDEDCQKAAKQNYEKALSLCPPTDLEKKTREKLLKVDENIKKQGW